MWVGCRPPPGRAESFLVLALKAVADVLNAGQSEAVQRIRNRLQVSLRQMQVLSGGLQVAMTEQHLDGAQVGAGLQQVCGPTVTQRVGGGVTRLLMPARRAASLQAIHTVLSEIG